MGIPGVMRNGICDGSKGDIEMTDRGTGDRLEGTIDEMKGHGKQALGDLTGDDRMKAEGMADEIKGKAEQAWGDVKEGLADLKDDIEGRAR
jgi:uncharacterized protein YjbJ (UPF0337 family)